MMNQELPNILHALLLAHGKPLSVARLQELLSPEQLDSQHILRGLEQLQQQLANSPLQLTKTASGYRLQLNSNYNSYIERLWEERPQRYSRALLETLALIAYRQPVTRGEIEDVRGVAVSSHIIRTLQERGWVKVVGHKEVPGRPALFATSQSFLDYFNLQTLDELPPLQEVRDLSQAFARLQDNLEQPAAKPAAGNIEIEPQDEERPMQELSFSHLLAELEKMEADLKTDFVDLQADVTPDELESP